METFDDQSNCLICFNKTEEKIYVEADISEKILNICIIHLHSAITKHSFKDIIDLKNENQLPFCKSCFDSALELAQLSEELGKYQKKISDLTVAFSLTVFHRRSAIDAKEIQNYHPNLHERATIQLDVSCLPSDLFKENNNSQNFNQIYAEDYITQNEIEGQSDGIANVNFDDEIAEFEVECDSFSESHPTVTEEKPNLSIQFFDENEEVEDYNEQMTTTRMYTEDQCRRNIHVTAQNGSNELCSSGATMSMSLLMNTVTMPEIRLKRIKIGGEKFQGSIPISDNSRHSLTHSLNVTCSPDFSRRPKWPKPNIVNKLSGNFNWKKPKHTKGRSAAYCCSLCDKPLDSEGELYSHEKTHNGGKVMTDTTFTKQSFNDQ